MNDKRIKQIIEQNQETLDRLKRLVKMQHTMNFGEISVQYDYCLN